MANLRVRQAADYVGLSKSALDKFRCYGGGPVYVKLGASVIYSSDDLDAWIAKHRRAPANDKADMATRASS